MSKIDGLIKRLCPNGVKYKTIKDITKVLRGKRLTTKELNDDESFPVYHGGLEPLGYYHDFNRVGDTVMVINVGASAGTVGYSKCDFWSSDGCYCIEHSDMLLNRYLYHYLKNNELYFIGRVRKAGIPTLDGSVIERFKVAIPPIEVQEEIVKILDKFGELEAELEAELESRKSQYEFWRGKLFHNKNIMHIEDICINITSGGTPDTSHEEYYNGNIPWLRTQEVNWNVINDTEIKISEEALKKSSAKIIPKNCVIVAMYGATVGRVAINNIMLSTNQACCNLEINSSIANYKYVFYWLSNQYKYIKSLGQGSQTNINAKIVKKLEIPVPSLEEQERIVSILDKFDKLVNDISVGLPAEIEARRKQYEYYRNKLLSFEEVSCE